MRFVTPDYKLYRKYQESRKWKRELHRANWRKHNARLREIKKKKPDSESEYRKSQQRRASIINSMYRKIKYKKEPKTIAIDSAVQNRTGFVLAL